MIEEVEITYGLRGKNGKFVRINGDHKGIYGDEFHLTTDDHDQIFRTEMLNDVMRLVEFEINEWGTSESSPSNRRIWKNISNFDIVAFHTTRIYDIEGGDAVRTSEVIGKPVLKYISGIEPQGLMFDRNLTPPRADFKNERELYQNDTERSPFFEEIYLVADREPEPGMFLVTRQNNTLEVLAAKRVMNPHDGPTYAVLLNANPNYAFNPEIEPYAPAQPDMEFEDSSPRL